MVDQLEQLLGFAVERVPDVQSTQRVLGDALGSVEQLKLLLSLVGGQAHRPLLEGLRSAQPSFDVQH